MCGYSWNQHNCLTNTALWFKTNMFCSIAVPSRSCGLISLQYRIPPAIQNLNSNQMAIPAMEGSLMWKFHLGMEMYLALSTVTYCWYLRQKTLFSPANYLTEVIETDNRHFNRPESCGKILSLLYSFRVILLQTKNYKWEYRGFIGRRHQPNNTLLSIAIC